MTIITGIFRNGRVELDGPVPDWAEGSTVTVTKPETAADDIDITGDSPEAIAAWIMWYDKLLAIPKSEAAAVELEQILNDSKAEELARWEEDGKRIEGLFP